MKKAICFALCAVITLCFSMTAGSVRAESVSSEAADSANDISIPTVSAEAYALYCADNGELIAAENENKKMKPASTTKIMTSLIALEQSAAADVKVTFTDEMVAEGSSMYLKIGDQVKLSDLAAGMMMASGNDAANAAALTVCESTEAFAELMNTRAAQIGMKNTHFVTPSGLDDDNHYSTAYDMALLMTYALENEDFAQLTSQKSVTVNFIKPENQTASYSNHNRLLSLYEYCIGGKTGYTKAAGRCLVSAAEKDGLTLICVTFNDRNDWNDHISLYNYGFEKYCAYTANDTEFCIDVPCVGSESDSVTLTGEKDIDAVVSADDRDEVERRAFVDSFLYAPIKENDVCGRIEYRLKNEVIASVNLVAAEEIYSKKENKSIWDSIKELFTYG